MRAGLPLAQSGQAAHEGNLNVVLTVYPERKRNQELESWRSLKKEKQKWQGKNKVAKPAVYETIQKKGQGWTSGAEVLSCARDHKAEASFQTRGEKLSQHAPGLTNSMSMECQKAFLFCYRGQWFSNSSCPPDSKSDKGGLWERASHFPFLGSRVFLHKMGWQSQPYILLRRLNGMATRQHLHDFWDQRYSGNILYCMLH